MALALLRLDRRVQLKDAKDDVTRVLATMADAQVDWRVCLGVFEAARTQNAIVPWTVTKVLMSLPPWHVALGLLRSFAVETHFIDVMTPPGAEVYSRVADLCLRAGRRAEGNACVEALVAAGGQLSQNLIRTVPLPLIQKCASAGAMRAPALCPAFRVDSDWRRSVEVLRIVTETSRHRSGQYDEGTPGAPQSSSSSLGTAASWMVDQADLRHPAAQQSAVLELFRGLRNRTQWEASIALAAALLKIHGSELGSAESSIVYSARRQALWSSAGLSCAVASAADANQLLAAYAILHAMRRRQVPFSGSFLSPLIRRRPLREDNEAAEKAYVLAVDLLRPDDARDPRTLAIMLSQYGTRPKARLCLSAFDTVVRLVTQAGASGSKLVELEPPHVANAVSACKWLHGPTGWERAMRCCADALNLGVVDGNTVLRFPRVLPGPVAGGDAQLLERPGAAALRARTGYLGFSGALVTLKYTLRASRSAEIGGNRPSGVTKQFCRRHHPVNRTMAAVRGFPSVEAFVAAEAEADVVLLEGPATHAERYFPVPASSLAALCPVLAACATTDDAVGSVGGCRDVPHRRG
jgi:hypothetical protein